MARPLASKLAPAKQVPTLIEEAVTIPENVKAFWNKLTSELGQDDEVSSSITQTWTDQAIKCYLTNADCANCSIPRGQYSFTCQMNKVVPVLLKTIGQPDLGRVNKMTPYLDQY